MIGWFCESYYKIREGMGRDETGGGEEKREEERISKHSS